MYHFSKSQYLQTLRHACSQAKEDTGIEICGLMIDTGCHLHLVRTKNTSRKVGGFAFSPAEIRRIVVATKVLGQEIVGTFHSHPVGVATPGRSDIEHAVNDSLMLIFDCLGKNGMLWKIKGGKASPLSFGFIKNKRCNQNPSKR